MRLPNTEKPEIISNINLLLAITKDPSYKKHLTKLKESITPCNRTRTKMFFVANQNSEVSTEKNLRSAYSSLKEISRWIENSLISKDSSDKYKQQLQQLKANLTNLKKKPSNYFNAKHQPPKITLHQPFGKLITEISPDERFKIYATINNLSLSEFEFGNRKVITINNHDNSYCIKFNPENAPKAMLAYHIADSLEFNSIPKTTAGVIKCGEKVVPILMTKYIKGENLQDLADNPEKLKNIDIDSVVILIILQLILGFEDGKANNYVAKKVAGQLALYCIDNDANKPGCIFEDRFGSIYARIANSLLFIFKDKLIISNTVLSRLSSLNPKEKVEHFLKSAIEINDILEPFMKELDQYFDEHHKENFNYPLLFLKGQSQSIIKILKTIKTFATASRSKKKAVTIMDLLKAVNPSLEQEVKANLNASKNHNDFFGSFRSQKFSLSTTTVKSKKLKKRGKNSSRSIQSDLSQGSYLLFYSIAPANSVTSTPEVELAALKKSAVTSNGHTNQTYDNNNCVKFAGDHSFIDKISQPSF